MVGADPGGGFQELAAALDDSAPAFAAGVTFHYSNVAFGLLGELVARHRGTTGGSRRSPGSSSRSAMTRTTYLPQEPHATGWSVHHYAGTLTPEPAPDTGAMAPAGQVWSTVTDLARFATFLLDGHPDVLPRATLDEMSTPQSAPVPRRWPPRTVSASRSCVAVRGWCSVTPGRCPASSPGCSSTPSDVQAAVTRQRHDRDAV